MINPIHFLKVISNYKGAIKASLFPQKKLRFINWYLLHGCDLSCSYCIVTKQKVAIMDSKQRNEALSRVRGLCVQNAVISIMGGEPSLQPNLLIEAVNDARIHGFLVNMVSNGYGLTPEIIKRLSKAGLHYLAISVDFHNHAEKSNFSKACDLLVAAKQEGILPVINTVITKETDIILFKQYAKSAIDKGIFLSPLVCSAKVPMGVFSNAPRSRIPTNQQLRRLVRWLLWQKITTGFVTASIGYLMILLKSGTYSNDYSRLWHCSNALPIQNVKNGRGFITIDSDGAIGPCQEFPRLANLLEIPYETLSLELLDKIFAETTKKCPGCLHNCYIIDEQVRGLKALAELITLIQMVKIKINK